MIIFSYFIHKLISAHSWQNDKKIPQMLSKWDRKGMQKWRFKCGTWMTYLSWEFCISSQLMHPRQWNIQPPPPTNKRGQNHGEPGFILRQKNWFLVPFIYFERDKKEVTCTNVSWVSLKERRTLEWTSTISLKKETFLFLVFLVGTDSTTHRSVTIPSYPAVIRVAISE